MAKGEKPAREHWKLEPEDHDFPAAHDYLSLLFPEPVAAGLVDELRGAPTRKGKAKDLLRASCLELLPEDNVHVRADLDKVHGGQRLSPVLLVRGDGARAVPLTVADGYHRICASHHIDENAEVPYRMVSLAPDDSERPGA